MFTRTATPTDGTEFIEHLFGDNPPQELLDLFAPFSGVTKVTERG
ncbi:hypothetical protein AB0M22_31630 [Nocardia sp. NPDC051756]